MSTAQIVATVVIVVGLLIIGATVLSALKSGSAPFGFEAGKEGVKVQTTFIGASLLAGLVIFLGAGYFFSSDYEKRVGDLNKRVEILNEIIDRSRGVDLNARLIFPDAIANQTKPVATISITRNGKYQSQASPLDDALYPTERAILIPELHPGDEVTIHVDAGDKKYKNKQVIRIPNSSIEMVPE
jgi:hypothetical protein